MVKYTDLGKPTKVLEIINSNKDEVEVSTVPPDPRFPNQNQTRYCYTSFLDFHRCKKRHNEEYEACQYFKKVYSTMCPKAWVSKWEEQIENGTFAGNI